MMIIDIDSYDIISQFERPKKLSWVPIPLDNRVLIQMLKDQTIGAVNTGKGENQHDDPMDLREQSCFMFQFSSVINLVFSVPLTK